jgi:vesicle-fusing ATPase
VPFNLDAFDITPPNKRIGKVKFELSIKQKSSSLGLGEKQEIDALELKSVMKNNFLNSTLNKNHSFFVSIGTAVLIANCKEIEVEELVQNLEKIKFLEYGLFTKDSDFTFDVNPKYKTEIKLKNVQSEGKAILVRNFEGVGGLGKELDDIFRIAFSSRRYPASYLEKYGMTHVKGILLHGPPGTGKTLIARTLANALNAAECKVVNGPELFDKYVGETEKKIRELFSKAEEDQTLNGDESGLHVIVFDEMDSICRARGSINSGTGVHDNAVNQLLAKIDGVEALNNILIIGMTNRKDLMDEAILRPGRLELHVEIGLPNEKGRLEILNIHTKKMRENELLEQDVNLEELATLTKNYTGSELEALVKRASTYALNKGIDFKTQKVDLSKYNKIAMKDFINAFNEIKPQFGSDNQSLQNAIQLGMINYGSKFNNIQNKLHSLVDQIKNSKSCLLSVLLEGPSGTGKTALACSLAIKSGFPYIKLISSETLVGFLETGKIGAITKIFEDAYKSPLSLVILDNIERLIEYVNVGPRFSNLVLQTLLVYIKKLPPQKDRKIMIIGTTSKGHTLEVIIIL